MNKDRLFRIFTALVILLAILFFSVGKWTYSGIAILAALAARAPDTGQAPPPEQTMSLKRLSWEHVQRVLAEHDGNISATARALHMHRRTLQRMLQKRPVQN